MEALRKYIPILPALLLGLLAGKIFAAPAETEKKKVVFIAGKPSHGPGQHEHRAGCMLLADQLNKSGLPVTSTVVTDGWPQDESAFDDAAAVVIYSDGGGGNPANAHLDTLKKLMDRGVGIGMIHYAVETAAGDPGNAFLNAIGGFFEADWSVNPHWTAHFTMPAHPVTSGIADYEMNDEWYYHMRFRKDMQGVTSILTDLPPPDSLSRPDGPHEGNPEVRAAVLDRKEPQTMMWVFDRPVDLGGGRGFGFTGGHYHKNWANDSQRRVVLNAILWIAGMDVPKDGAKSPTPTEKEMKANLDPK